MKQYNNALLIILGLMIAMPSFAQKEIATQTNSVYLDVGSDKRDYDPSDIVVTWIAPEEVKSQTFDREFILKIGINSGSEITGITVLNNDQPFTERGFQVVEEDRGYEKFDEYLEKKMRLFEGENNITIALENSANKKITETRTIIVPSDDQALARTDYALLIATDSYDSWDDLVNPVNDAKTIADELQNNYGYEVELITNPSRDEVMIKLREYSQKSYLPLDQLFIFFAGHGQFDEAFGEGYIVARDSERNDQAKTSYISHSVLRNVIDNIPTEHTFLAMDVCFGGTFDPTIAKSSSRGADEQYQEITTNEFVKRKLRYKTRVYVTSGGKEYVPDGRAGMHSPFARKVIEGLRTYGGGDSVLTLSELFGFVERISPEPRAGEFGSNAPGSDFLFIAERQL